MEAIRGIFPALFISSSHRRWKENAGRYVMSNINHPAKTPSRPRLGNLISQISEIIWIPAGEQNQIESNPRIILGIGIRQGCVLNFDSTCQDRGVGRDVNRVKHAKTNFLVLNTQSNWLSTVHSHHANQLPNVITVLKQCRTYKLNNEPVISRLNVRFGKRKFPTMFYLIILVPEQPERDWVLNEEWVNIR